MNICIIPARGGSKRIPRKNIKDFCGKPIIAYPIDAALKSGLFDGVVVSTDDEEIAQVAMQYGAKVPFMRPKELSDDFTGTTPVIIHALDELKKQGKVYEYACCIYATSPFVTTDNIKMGLDGLKNSDKLFSFSVCAFSAPVFRSFMLKSDKSIEMFWPENYTKRSQDLPKAYFDAAQFYWGKSKAFSQNLNMFDTHSIGIELPSHMVQDIDTLDDWERAEMAYKAWFRL